ncbi:M67 family metallopeptidase [Paenibacillus solisilvae]|uniref:M67 family metallopeptidase n=1 Tax=Paenibacillus solisilvae TaxID=2486751 RepID=A0ABW0W5D9_9BACL
MIRQPHPASLGQVQSPSMEIASNGQSPSKAEITTEAWLALIESCTSELPNEACGILACSQQPIAPDGLLRIDRIFPIRNASSSSKQTFTFDPKEWVQALLSIQKNRQSLVGFYHSHPTTAPVPSLADLEGMKYAPAASYWIVSLADSQHPVVQPYWFNGTAFIPLMFAQISV